MLLQFSVANFASFKDEVLLNMVPAKSRLMKDHVIADKTGKHTDALPLAAIYGANASGKTNLVNAIAFAQNLILSGTRSDNLTGVRPHLLDAETEKSPSRFEFVFKHDGILYTYGFLVSARTVHEEWLFAYYSSQESCVFERVTKDNRTEVKPGTRLIADSKGTQFINLLAQGTRPNQLFLTEANERNVALVKPVIHWFAEHLCIVRPDSLYRALALRADKDKDFAEYLSDFLRIADTGIESIRCEREELDSDKYLQDIPTGVRQEILEKLDREDVSQLLIQASPETFMICQKESGRTTPSIRCLTLRAEHRRSDGAKVTFDITNESDGTRRLMHLAPILQQIWASDSVYIIDELERSLHPYLSRLFIQAGMIGIKESKARGQCVVTTHDTNLLDRTLLRRDEIWFMEKDEHSASHLTSLAEYRLSEGLNYENGYLNGRFGAIPFVGDIKELLQGD